ncbi:MAG: SDR family NAD(P)-dependent oxidoreductase [Armatimonadetes bacterium]|nr:SDR family NAD(P)-dependent oxidoreductase [Armatimonadota bacterium]
MFSLSGKVALITGAASGIGEASARAYAEAGASVCVADRDAEGGRRVAEAIRGTFLACDGSREADCRRAAQHILDTHGRCDVLVNDAGIGHVGTALTTTEEDFDRLYAVNVKGLFLMSQAVLPAMIARRTGSIVNLASIGGVIGIRDRLAYCATIFAVVGLTKSMALDHADAQVRVNCLCPGRVETPFAFVRARVQEYPASERAYAEIAAALYLAADESAFVTGSALIILIIDGGWSAGK